MLDQGVTVEPRRYAVQLVDAIPLPSIPLGSANRKLTQIKTLRQRGIDGEGANRLPCALELRSGKTRLCSTDPSWPSRRGKGECAYSFGNSGEEIGVVEVGVEERRISAKSGGLPCACIKRRLGQNQDFFFLEHLFACVVRKLFATLVGFRRCIEK